MNKTIDERILEKLRSIIAEKLGVELDEVTMEADLRNDLGADSLDIIEIFMDTEKGFNCDISDDRQDEIRTVGDVISAVKETSKLKWIRNGQVQSAAVVAPKAAEPAQKAASQKPSAMVLFFMTRGGKKLSRKTPRKSADKFVMPQKPMMFNPGKKR